MSAPSVSVLLPVRDAAPWLDGALASLARQTCRDLEIIAVDDGSTDGSGAVLDSWAHNDPRISVIHQPPIGLVPSLNLGLEHCRGELLARMDADDVSHPRRIELQAGLLSSRPEIGAKAAQDEFWIFTSERQTDPSCFGPCIGLFLPSYFEIGSWSNAREGK